MAQTSSLQTQLTTTLGRIQTLEARDSKPQDKPAEAGSSSIIVWHAKYYGSPPDNIALGPYCESQTEQIFMTSRSIISIGSFHKLSVIGAKLISH
ncbi:hypothetical protein Tco_0241558 [Tanacetum coccineum]